MEFTPISPPDADAAAAARARQDILTKANTRMGEVVKKLAEERGIDLVIEEQATAYFKPTMDITADATAAYDKAHPVAAAPVGK